MSDVTVREFSYNPSAMFARAEHGESLTVTRHGQVIAIVVPASGSLGRYSGLVARGQIKLKTFTTDNLASLPRYTPSGDADPLDTLLAMRDEDADR